MASTSRFLLLHDADSGPELFGSLADRIANLGDVLVPDLGTSYGVPSEGWIDNALADLRTLGRDQIVVCLRGAADVGVRLAHEERVAGLLLVQPAPHELAPPDLASTDDIVEAGLAAATDELTEIVLGFVQEPQRHEEFAARWVEAVAKDAGQIPPVDRDVPRASLERHVDGILQMVLDISRGDMPQRTGDPWESLLPQIHVPLIAIRRRSGSGFDGFERSKTERAPRGENRTFEQSHTEWPWLEEPDVVLQALADLQLRARAEVD